MSAPDTFSLHATIPDRELTNLSQRELAKTLGLSRSFIWTAKSLARIPEPIFEEMLAEGLSARQMIIIWRQQIGQPLKASGGHRCPNCGHSWSGPRASQGGAA